MGCDVDDRVETELSVEVGPGVLVGVGVTVGIISVTVTAGAAPSCPPPQATTNKNDVTTEIKRATQALLEFLVNFPKTTSRSYIDWRIDKDVSGITFQSSERN